MLVKVAVVCGVVVGVSAVFLMLPIFQPFIDILLVNSPQVIQDYIMRQHDESSSKPDRLFTKSELEAYSGEVGSKGLYIAILGKVFDVAAGERHYVPGQSYHHFAGRDASRSYVTGSSDEDLSDDVSDFNPTQMLQLMNWLKFYEKKEEYEYIGKLIGAFYDSDGHRTRQYYVVLRQAQRARDSEKKVADKKIQFPPCNVMWSQEEGSVVWCTNESGGISRDWAGLPRQYFEPGSNLPRCACVRNDGPPTGQWDSTSSRGDLDDPSLREYSGCDPRSPLCKLPDS